MRKVINVTTILKVISVKSNKRKKQPYSNLGMQSANVRSDTADQINPLVQFQNKQILSMLSLSLVKSVACRDVGFLKRKKFAQNPW